METITQLFAGSNEFSMYYDEPADVLYITFADEDAVGHHLNDHVLVRQKPETGEVVGITVMDAKSVLDSDSDALQLAPDRGDERQASGRARI